MRKMIAIGAICFVTSCMGCATTATSKSQVGSPCQDTCQVPTHNKVVADSNTSDGEVKSTTMTTGEILGQGYRMVWDNTKKAYVYVTSDETKDKLIKAWQATKKVGTDLKDGVVKGYNQ